MEKTKPSSSSIQTVLPASESHQDPALTARAGFTAGGKCNPALKIYIYLLAIISIYFYLFASTFCSSLPENQCAD